MAEYGRIWQVTRPSTVTETDFRDNNGNIEALASQESDLKQDIETLYNGENGLNTKD